MEIVCLGSGLTEFNNSGLKIASEFEKSVVISFEHSWNLAVVYFFCWKNYLNFLCWGYSFLWCNLFLWWTCCEMVWPVQVLLVGVFFLGVLLTVVVSCWFNTWLKIIPSFARTVSKNTLNLVNSAISSTASFVPHWSKPCRTKYVEEKSKTFIQEEQPASWPQWQIRGGRHWVKPLYLFCVGEVLWTREPAANEGEGGEQNSSSSLGANIIVLEKHYWFRGQ